MSGRMFTVTVSPARTIGFKMGELGEQRPPARVHVSAQISAEPDSLKAALDEAYVRLLTAARKHSKGVIAGDHHNERFDLQLTLEVHVEAGL